MSAPNSRLPACALLAAALALASAPAAAEAPAPPAATLPASAPASAAAPADLKEAVQRLAAAASPAAYAASLGSFSSSLPPADALALLGQGLPGAAPEYRTPLLVKAGDLALLLGLFAEAGRRYEEAAAGAPGAAADGALLLRSARCLLAAGEFERASRISSDLIAGAAEPSLAAAARIVAAWSLLLRDRSPDARAISSSIAADQAAPAAQRREARFILWLASAAGEKAAAAAALEAEFPGSPEALVASGAASPPPLPHWYLGGLTAATAPKVAKAKAEAPPSAAPTGPAEKTAPASADAAKGRRLQVGYFSLEENARTLRDELASKKIQAAIETRLRAGKPGAAEERRWIVVVDGGADAARTMQSLKDAGYESYLID